MGKRALLVGIDTYDHFNDLSACVGDVTALAPPLATHDDGTANFAVTTLVSTTARVDRSSLMRHVRQELASQTDMVLIYFAGHGAERAGDVILCTQEGNEHDEGVAFSALLGLINSSPIEEVIVILDCCFSGGAGSNPVIGGELSYVRPGVAIVTASRHDEVAEEMPTVGQGRFSYFLRAALDGGAADVLGNVGVIGAYAYLRESFGAGEQSPTFKCNVAQLHRLRRCFPAVPHDEMMRLPEFFEDDPRFELRLSPAYEPTSPPKDPVKEKTFGILQRFRAAKLVEPVAVPHMYDAAMKSRTCRLTPLGRHYRHLAERGLL